MNVEPPTHEPWPYPIKGPPLNEYKGIAPLFLYNFAILIPTFIFSLKSIVGPSSKIMEFITAVNS